MTTTDLQRALLLALIARLRADLPPARLAVRTDVDQDGTEAQAAKNG